ncbi:hypothetical protein AMECASPLE_032734 [Ameca splendens]|uniref:Uncharacterized protein n=1 Tax=Ameca splendens TaxID=208324 RepID=A0ABV0Y7B8_9TELE
MASPLTIQQHGFSHFQQKDFDVTKASLKWLYIKRKWVTGKLVPISSSLQARGRVHPGQVASPSQGNTETYRTCRDNYHAHTHSHLRAI